MSQKRPSTWGNPDRRHQTQFPAPAIEQIEQQLFSWLSPGSFKPLRDVETQQKLRDRLLTLPVMMAVVVSLVYRQIPSLSFDAFTQENKFFVTRLRSKTAYQVSHCLSQGSFYRDEIICLGQYRSNPCQYPLRLVSVLWGKTWYYYLTNVLDPQQLSAQQVCELYRRRWRIEEAFLLTKRLLGLAYLWVGGTNGVQIQLFATWIFYAVLNDLCSQVAVAVNQPKERISVEMLFRGLYHFARAFLRGDTTDVVTYLVEHYQLLGLVKAQRKRHRDKVALSSQIWVASG